MDVQGISNIGVDLTPLLAASQGDVVALVPPWYLPFANLRSDVLSHCGNRVTSIKQTIEPRTSPNATPNLESKHHKNMESKHHI